MDQVMLGLDLFLILALLLIGWHRLFALMTAITLFWWLHDLPDLNEFNAIMIPVVVFFFLAGTLVELQSRVGRTTL